MPSWSGSGAKEIGRDSLDGKVLVRVDPRLYRPLDVNFLRGSALDAENILGWRREIDFKVSSFACINHCWTIYSCESRS
jgi:GDPmannose 4,6-dehydratase